MKNNPPLCPLLLVLIFICPYFCGGQPVQKNINLKDFSFQSSTIIKEDGAQLSSSNYKTNNYWFPVQVPATVLSGLVANNVYPNPYFGMNNMRIPDASDSTNEVYKLSQYSFLPNQANPWKNPYWYRTSFELPKSYSGKQVWLNFKGINYRAEVWLDGHRVADSTQMVGMFKEYRFNVTDYVDPEGTNYLAVKIFPLDYPGLPSPPQLDALGPFYPNGGPTGDIGKNVAMLCSVGWDWMPAVRDREMGIWQPVFLSSSGPVTIERPHIITELPNLPDTSIAGINLDMELTNHLNEEQNGRLTVKIKPHNFEGSLIQFSKSQEIEAVKINTVHLSYDQIDDLNINNPKLWWPNGYGKANLYDMILSYEAGGQISDQRHITFGIRTVSSKVTDVKGWARRIFYLNGRPIDLTGGAWVPDFLLQRDSIRYAQELSLIKNSNLNTVRIWGGGIAPPDKFFDETDRLGLLVWQDFWVTGDTQGEFKGSPDWPVEGDVYIDNMKSTILRIRNHPSLLVWTGGNEGHARKELYQAMRENIAGLDGTRPFIPSSSGFAKLPETWKGSWPDNQPSGVYSGGPYSWQEPVKYYKLVEAGKDWMFKDEVGMPSQPPYNSLPKVIPDLVPDTSVAYPMNNTWGYHDAASGNGKYEIYYHAISDRFGKPEGFKDYSDKAQLANAEGYRAIFESVGSRLEDTGGVLLWKLNAAFPSVMWQIYDWFLNPNAGYYFTKKAVEPLHVQLTLDDSMVVVVNRQFEEINNLNVTLKLYDAHLNKFFEQSDRMDAAAQHATDVRSLATELKKRKALTFIELSLENDGKRISHNIYWLAPNNNFKSLNELPSTTLDASVQKMSQKNTWGIQLDNPTHRMAFFNCVSLLDSDKKEILPSYWSDNYISVGPKEQVILTVSTDGTQPAFLSVDGWNTDQKLISLNY